MIYERGNCLITGSTQSGKTFSEILAVLSAALIGLGIVVLDPHRGSLAWNVLQQLVAHGLQHRIIWDSLEELVYAPKYRFLKRSTAAHPLVRANENQQEAERFAELLCRRRGQDSLASNPLTEQWVMLAVLFLLNQPHDRPASDLRFALRPDRTREFQRLLGNCTDADIRFEFEKVASGEVKPGQYSSAQRLINAVCDSPAFIARCGTTWDLGTFLEGGGILLVEGGNVSPLVMQTILGSISLQTMHYVRARS